MKPVTTVPNRLGQTAASVHVLALLSVFAVPPLINSLPMSIRQRSAVVTFALVVTLIIASWSLLLAARGVIQRGPIRWLAFVVTSFAVILGPEVAARSHNILDPVGNSVFTYELGTYSSTVAYYALVPLGIWTAVQIIRKQESWLGVYAVVAFGFVSASVGYVRFWNHVLFHWARPSELEYQYALPVFVPFVAVVMTIMIPAAVWLAPRLKQTRLEIRALMLAFSVVCAGALLCTSLFLFYAGIYYDRRAALEEPVRRHTPDFIRDSVEALPIGDPARGHILTVGAVSEDRLKLRIAGASNWHSSAALRGLSRAYPRSFVPFALQIANRKLSVESEIAERAGEVVAIEGTDAEVQSLLNPPAPLSDEFLHSFCKALSRRDRALALQLARQIISSGRSKIYVASAMDQLALLLDQKDVMGEFEAFLESEERMIQYAAPISIARIGDSSIRIRLSLRCLTHEDRQVRVALLAEINESEKHIDSELREPIVRLLDSKDCALRRFAAYIFARESNLSTSDIPHPETPFTTLDGELEATDKVKRAALDWLEKSRR